MRVAIFRKWLGMPSRLFLAAACGISPIVSGKVFSEDVPWKEFTQGQHSCRLAPFITTHWDSVLGYRMGIGKDADTRDKLYPKDGYPFDDSKLPAYNNFHQMKTVGTAVKVGPGNKNDNWSFNLSDTNGLVFDSNGVADEIDLYALEFRRLVLKDTATYGSNTFLNILNYGNYENVLFGLQENDSNVQILNNVFLYNPTSGVTGLATITFPPKWSRNKKHPIYLHGNGYGVRNTNMQYTTAKSFTDPLLAAQSSKFMNGVGMIVVYVNNGGSEAQGVNSGFLSSLKWFFNTAIPIFGGDTSKILVAGSSRGGVESAVWGSLTDSLNIRSILSDVPPVKMASTAKGSLSTFPQLSAINLTLGSPSAWKIDYWASQEERAQAACKVLFNTTDLTAADDSSLFGIYKRVDSIKMDSKFIHFSYGSRDGFFPLGYFLQFDSLLTARKIRHSSNISYNLGHKASFPYKVFSDEWVKIKNGIDAGPYTGTTRKFWILKSLFAKTDPTSELALQFNESLVDTVCKYRPGYFSDGSSHSPDSLGFTAVIPYLTILDKPFEIALTGQTGKSWKIWARKNSGYEELFSAWGTFGTGSATSQDGFNPGIVKENGGEFSILRKLKFQTLDTLEWFFEYDGKEVPNRFTPFVSRDNVFLRAISYTAPYEDTTEISPGNEPFNRYIRNGRVSTCNGVDQIHTLLLQPNDTGVFTGLPEFLPISKKASSVGGKFVFDVRSFYQPGSDSDAQDTLRFDLQTVSGGIIRHGEMDRNLGIFSIDTGWVASGSYPLRVVLSDGKGGVSMDSLIVQVGD